MYKRYERYKDSGIEWIGEVPEHWSVNKLGYLLERNDGGVWGDDPNENGSIVLRSTEITLDGSWNINEPAKRSLSKKEYNNALLEKGDLLLTKSSGSEQHIGKTAIVDNNVAELRCAFSNFMQRLRTKKNLVPKYLYYFLNNNGREQLLHLSTTTTGLKNLSGSIINNLKVQAPTINEQTFISTFLNKKTSEIDYLIADKEELIKKLEEYKQSIITEAVTKGLNPDVKMKDSEIEWIGEIPEHWEIKKLGRISHIKGRIGWQGLRAEEFIDEGPYLITGVDFYNGDIDWDSCYHISEERYNQAPEIQVKDNDLLITKDGTIGKVAHVKNLPGKASLNSHLLVIRSIKSVFDHRYLFWVFHSDVFTHYVNLTQTGTTFFGITQNKIEKYLISLPPEHEQKAIVKYVDNIVNRTNGIIGLVELQIKNLKSYRQSLIFEAVTGKIDVRDYQPERSEKLA
jgi:type I restriction enzyme, S subunit